MLEKIIDKFYEILKKTIIGYFYVVQKK